MLTLDQGANSWGPKIQDKKLGSGTRTVEEGTARCGELVFPDGICLGGVGKEVPSQEAAGSGNVWRLAQ